MTDNQRQRILIKVKKRESSKEYVMKNFQEFGFPNKKEAIKFCTQQQFK